MKYDALRKHGNQWVTIRPSLQVYDEAGVLLHHVEEAWWLHDITEATAKLRSREGQRQREIGLDSIHSYFTDPEGPNKRGTTGILQLNVQLLLFGGELLTEVVAPPGTPLKHFVVSRTRETLYSVATKLAEETKMAKLRAEFAMSPSGIQGVQNELSQLEQAFKALAADLRGKGAPIILSTKRWDTKVLLDALGWWVEFSWRWSGRGLENSLLTVRKYNGHPPWPGVVAQDSRCVTTEQYSFNLVTPTEACWIDRHSPSRSFTTADLAAHVLADLIRRPNADPATAFDIGG